MVPDLFARVTLMDANNKIVTHLGDDSQSDYMQTRKLTRDHFKPGKLSVRMAHASIMKATSTLSIGLRLDA